MTREYHHIYVVNLRGNQRTAGEISRREGGKIFDAGSRATVAVTLLVRKPGPVPESGARLRYWDIGDYLTRDDKLRILDNSLTDESGAAELGVLSWTELTPNEHGDWINQRSSAFEAHLALHSETEPSVFGLRSNGLQTNRDAWNYNSSRAGLVRHQERAIAHFNEQVKRVRSASPAPSTDAAVAQLVDLDPTKFKWIDRDFARARKGRYFAPEDVDVRVATYRPFHRRFANASSSLNKRVSELPRAYPNADVGNLAVAVSTVGARADFSVLMTRDLPDVHLWVDDTPCLPRLIYDQGRTDAATTLFDSDPPDGAGARHNITDHALAAFSSIDPNIEKDDVFFYVYGVLHAPDYRRAFAADLKKSLPRIPQVSTSADFWAFATAGRELATLHTDYETIEPWPGLTKVNASGFRDDHPDAYRVLKMKHPKVTDPATGQRVEDRTRIVYNDWITICDIPERAYDYELGSRSAIGWVMDAWRVRTDKASGIVNDPNDWAIEHDDRTYIVDLVGRVVTVSMRTLEILDSLPPLEL